MRPNPYPYLPIPPHFCALGDCLPGAHPARYLCIKHHGSSPKSVLTEGSPPSRPHWTANLPAKHVWAEWLHDPCLLGGPQ